MIRVVVLGIDPGVRQTGIAALKIGPACQLLRSAVFTGGPLELGAELRRWHSPDWVYTLVAVEDQRYVQRGQTAVRRTNFAASGVRDAQWAAVGAASALSLPVVLVQPRTGKAALVSGKATKKQMIAMAAARFGSSIISEHVADAIGIALAAARDPLLRTALAAPDPAPIPPNQPPGCECMPFAKHYSTYLISKAGCPVHKDKR